ncbi:MAG: HAD family hydrolase [Thermoanaerobaculia bacterium]
MATRSRLLLFDVDGTLLSAGPASRAAFAGALIEVFGTSGDLSNYAFEGKLDPVIVGELMREAGIENEVVVERLPWALALYLDRLEDALAVERPRLKPCVPELLERVAASPTAVPALLTGNVERGARIKLSAAGLWHRFRFGVFGDEAPRREKLGFLALARAKETTGISFEGRDCIVVGDSPNDVACGKAIGARVVAVATGKTSIERLRAAGADVVFPDFRDLDAASEALLA